jgi:DNA-binding transcriptional LysR family regulator
MDNWDDLRFLVAVAKSGSMTAAARLLGTNVATVSRRIERLTHQLGAAPFVRTPEGWRPSPQVSGLIELASAFEGSLAAEINSSRPPGQDRQRVSVRLGAPPFITSRVLVPALSDPPARLSAVALEISDRITGEGLGEFDVIVRFGAPEAGRLRTKRVGSLSYRLFRRDDAPEATPGAGSDWIGLVDLHDDSAPMRMARERFAGPPSMRVATFDALAEVIGRTGLPGPLPDIVGRRSGLAPLDGAIDPGPWVADFWIAYHESRRGDPAIEATVAWIEGAFARVAG